MNKNMSESKQTEIFKLLRLSATDRFRVNSEDAIRRRSPSIVLETSDSALQNKTYVIIDNS